jgi:hypothetical protein
MAIYHSLTMNYAIVIYHSAFIKPIVFGYPTTLIAIE